MDVQLFSSKKGLFAYFASLLILWAFSSPSNVKSYHRHKIFFVSFNFILFFHYETNKILYGLSKC